ncbi:hypothetical protein Q0S98_23470, partial [Escherichia coli O187:H52]
VENMGWLKCSGIRISYLVEKVGTYVTNTGLMATYGSQFTLTSDLYDECHRVAKQRDPPCVQKA